LSQIKRVTRRDCPGSQSVDLSLERQPNENLRNSPAPAEAAARAQRKLASTRTLGATDVSVIIVAQTRSDRTNPVFEVTGSPVAKAAPMSRADYISSAREHYFN